MSAEISVAVRIVARGRGSFLAVYEFMWKDLGLSGVPLLVYARIYGFCKRGGLFFESRAKTADYLDVSERAVIKALNKLVGEGLVIEVGRHTLRNGRKTKAFALSTKGSVPTVTNCHSGSLPDNEQSSPEQSSSGTDEMGEPKVGSGMNGIHASKDSKNKRNEREGLAERFAKYDE